jgi:hypothetical protein
MSTNREISDFTLITAVSSGYLGANGQYMISNGTSISWANAVAGAAGGGPDRVFYENDIAVTYDYTIGTNKNAMTAGPISVNAGITVTVPSGSTWTVI